MSWQDRRREAAYTSPRGKRLTFLYTGLAEEFDQKGKAYNFADADGTYVQPMGSTGRRYPLKIITSGANYDRDADAWMDALAERGEGVLENPVYGRKNVVPVGRVKRTDDTVRAANQAVIEVVLFETIGAVYPTGQADPSAEVEAQAALADAAQGQQLATSDALGTAQKDASFLDQYNEGLDAVEEFMRDAADEVASAQKQFDAIQSSINRGITVLISQPLALVAQTQQLIKSPGRAISQIEARLSAYKNLFAQLTGQDAKTRAQLYNGDLYASATAIAHAQAAAKTEFQTQDAAVSSAEDILSHMDVLAAWREEGFPATGETDTGDSWKETQQLLATAAGALIAISFGLAVRKVYKVSTPRTIIDLAFELFGDVDTRLDHLINVNNLTGADIIELKRGREIAYYE